MERKRVEGEGREDKGNRDIEIEEGEEEEGESISPTEGLVYYTLHYRAIYTD